MNPPVRSRLVESPESPARIQAAMLISAGITNDEPTSTLHKAGLDAVASMPSGEVPPLVLSTWLKLRDIPQGDPIRTPLAITAADPDGQPVFPSADTPGVVLAVQIDLPARSMGRLNLCFHHRLLAAAPASIPTRVTFRATLAGTQIGWTDLEILPATQNQARRTRTLALRPTRRDT